MHPDQPDKTAATPDEFEWVNAWAAQGVVGGVGDGAAPRGSNVVPLRIVPETPQPVEDFPLLGEAQTESAARLKKPREHQVVLDILAIIRARDALTEVSTLKSSDRGWGSILVNAHRTADSVPVILGSVMGLLMVIVFSTAAAFVKLAR